MNIDDCKNCDTKLEEIHECMPICGYDTLYKWCSICGTLLVYYDHKKGPQDIKWYTPYDFVPSADKVKKI